MDVPKKQERAVVTVMGHDRVGIVAGISQVLAEHGVNIIDLTSTEMRGLFIMIILVDTASSKTPMNKLQEALKEKGDALGVQVMAQHEDVFRYMHRV